MLSRIGESLFWIGRYLERADDTARLLDVQMQMLVEDPAIDEVTSCQQLFAVMGIEGFEGVPNRWSMLDLLAYDQKSSSSIASVIGSMREAARSARETLSTDVWSAINTTWQGVPAATSMRPAEMFNWVRRRTAMIAGTADDSMPRDQGWYFYVLGRNIERTDMTARLLSTAASAGASGIAWQNTLRACGGYESFLRTYRGIERDSASAEYLLLDRWFPRSLISSLSEAERALTRLDVTGRRAGFSDEALRLLGRARTEIEYRPLNEILETMPVEMERLQRACSAASDAITARYFAQEDWHSWRGRVSL
ncbi:MULTISPECIES: alpha-E domain-containing protein [Aeromicrobium]|uniref:Alpha-E domain-containing protein n=1 Tax=Aeromicrobium phoceense TaxID=2754045 RepID=A0A838XKX5_9ACTN|nr:MULTISPECIES: alpha-E domain-containing protein [Aeromicrobium]MBA4607520.1 alpha-E domain-containing protein [Aeromicrobium phoceense]